MRRLQFQVVVQKNCSALFLTLCSFLSARFQVLIQGLQNLNRAVHQDVVAVQLLPRDQWVAPSSFVLQDDGGAKDENTEEDDEEKAVSWDLTSISSLLTVGNGAY